MPRETGRSQQEGRATRWIRSLLKWCDSHPIALLVSLVVTGTIALTSMIGGIQSTIGVLWPDGPRVLGLDKDLGAAGNFSITVENPKDVPMVVTDAILRAEPPPVTRNANDARLIVPAVVYSVPFDCSPGTKRVKLRPAFKVPAKDVGAVVFRSTLPMRDCQLFVSLNTSQGQTNEQEGFSLASWRTKPTE